MSHILAINSDGLSSPSIKLKLPPQTSLGSHPFGWGFGWYPNDNQAAMLAKDPSATDVDILTHALVDWSHFRSTTFFCKVRGAASGYTYHETQPFTRSFAGRDWLFFHNGYLDRDALKKVYRAPSHFLEPLGKTDSELAFCFLLSHISERGARKISDLKPSVLLQWFEFLDTLGSADMCLSDGRTMICFSGTETINRLRYTRLRPPHINTVLTSGEAVLEFDGARDTYRTSFLVTSLHFDVGSWTQMAPGQMILVRRGAIVYDNKPHETVQDVRVIGQIASEHNLSSPHSMDVQFSSQGSDPLSAPPESRRVHFPTRVKPSIATPSSVRLITHNAAGQPLTFRVYDVVHRTKYTYQAPVEHSTHVFRLHPTEDQLQEVVDARVEISVAGEQLFYDDVFGNRSMHVTLDTVYDEMEIIARSRIKIFAQPEDNYALKARQTTIPLVWMPWQRQMMMAYLLPEEMPESQLMELRDYAMSFVERNDHNILATLEDINMSIYRDYAYVQGTTSLNTTPFQVYTTREGVCQDFANLMICLTRLLSIPARYRMGYIYTGVSYDNKIQSEASHAWVEVYLPYVGWRGYDPTNGCMVGQDHVRVACGRNYRDATPTSGTIYKGGGTETLEVDVKMTEVLA